MSALKHEAEKFLDKRPGWSAATIHQHMADFVDHVQARKKPSLILPLALNCPSCGARHVDEGEWESRPHRTHLCLECGIEFEVTVCGV